jgi:hypothetical protein
MWWLRTLALFLASLVLSAPATAEVIRNFKVGSWFAGAYTSNTDGKFSHCGAAGRYRSGIMFLFLIDRDYDWAISLSNDAWRLKPGDRYTVVLKIDEGAPIVRSAIASTKDSVRIPLSGVELFRQFQRGYLLTIVAAGETMEFTLTDTSRLLTELVECVDTFKDGAVQATRNPFEGKSRPPVKTSNSRAVSREQNRAEATAFMANLLSRSAIKGFRFLREGDAGYSADADAQWATERALGFVVIVRPEEASNANNVRAELLAEAAKDCSGKFVSGSIPESRANKELTRLFTACEREKESVTHFYLVAARPTGGFYVLVTTGLGADEKESGQQADASIRNAFFPESNPLLR